MRYHIQYSFLALILCVLLLCIISYVTFLHPVKHSTSLDNIKPDVRQLLQQTSGHAFINRNNDTTGKNRLNLKDITNLVNIRTGTRTAENGENDEDDYIASSSSLSIMWVEESSSHLVELDELRDDTQEVNTNEIGIANKGEGINVKGLVDESESRRTSSRVEDAIALAVNQMSKKGINKYGINTARQINNLTRTNNKSQIKDRTKYNMYFKSSKAISSNVERQKDKPTHCTPKKNIVFLKTHKCATSTVQNIMFRYGDKHQLKFVLPKSKRDHRFSLKEPFNRRQVLRGDDDQEYFNVFTNHAIFEKNEIEAIMPTDSIYVSIVRDPVSMYESIFTYMRLDLRFSPDDGRHLVSMEEFLDNAPHFYQNWSEVYSAQYSRNPMLYDFGLRPEDTEDNTKITELISMINKRFDFIMIADYFEESLIMLKHLLCLELSDITYLTFNARSKESVRDINDSLSKKIRAWNWGDVQLYNYFKRTFQDKLKLFDHEKMKQEIRELRKSNTRLEKTCVSDVAVDMESIWHPEGIKIEGFKLKKSQQNENGLCKKITRAEKVYTDILKLRQSASG